MLCKLSLKNIKKSFKDYAIYFFTLILGVSIFYIFNAIESQTVMMNVSSSTRDIIKLMNNLLSGVSVFVSFILGFLIIYASRFLIKRRNKEFGIYLTLGMGKRKISTILLLETLLIGIISLVVGLLLGITLSQFMSLFVANMFEADLTEFVFVLSKSAIIKTLVYFGIIYLIVAIFNVINITRVKLIDLIHSDKKSEKVRLKNSIICSIVFVVAVLILAYAYYLVTDGLSILDNVATIFVPIFFGVIGTFLLFWSLSGLVLRIVKSIRKVYYKELNSFVVRQISSKINTTVVSMSVICLMLFVTICVLSSALSLKNSITANLKELVPFDIEMYKNVNLDEYKNSIMENDSKISVIDSLKNAGFDTDKYLIDVILFSVYSTTDLKVQDTLGSYYERAVVEYPMLDYESTELFINVSDYNKVAKAFGNEEIVINDDEYAIVADFDGWLTIRNNALKSRNIIRLLGKEYKPKYDECINGFIQMTSSHINTGIFVVPDEAVNDSFKEQSLMLANYNANSDEEKEDIESMIINLMDNDYISQINLKANSKISIYENSVGLSAMVTFIGIYLGVIFLISSAAILALKELSESSDNKERYMMIRKLGADEKVIKKALFKQTIVIFGFPLLIAIIHSIFGIRFCNEILSVVGNEKLLASIVMTALVIVLIYGGYFIITYLVSKNIIRE